MITTSERKDPRTFICIGIFAGVNFLFAVKYLERLTSFYLPAAILIALFYILVWRFRYMLQPYRPVINIAGWMLIAAYIAGSVYLFGKISQESLGVDRWSVISSFWDNYFKGRYTYLATSHMGNYPGPMPFYYILALPFYLTGELGYFSLFGIFPFLLLLRSTKTPVVLQTVYIVWLLSSFFFFWEVLCRSNVFLNGSLVLISIVYLFYSIENKKAILWNGVFIGLMLSTRNVFVIAYAIAFLYIFRHTLLSLVQIVYIGIVTVLVFALTFVPFVYGHWEEFRRMNPFIIQSDYLMPAWLSVSCVILSIFSFFLLKKKSDVYFYSGVSLFLTISVYFVYHVLTRGFVEAYFNSSVDISYFILSIPFCMYYLFEKES